MPDSYIPYTGWYVDRLVNFYVAHSPFVDPPFEDAEVKRVLRIERLLFYTKIFRYAGRKLREHIRARVEAQARKLFGWMRRQASWMEAATPVDKDNTTK